MSQGLRDALQCCFTPEQLRLLGETRVGVVGCGGIGSNIAPLLVRSGVRRLLLVDFDVVECSNLNRQLYLPEDIGSPKVSVLASHLLRLAPDLEIETMQERVDENTLPALLPRADIWVEAMDEAVCKRMLVEQAIMACLPVVACSGMAGIGGPVMSRRRIGTCTLVGDMVSDVADKRPYAPRVTACAALMADVVLCRVLGLEG